MNYAQFFLKRITPRGLLAFWRNYRIQWRHLKKHHRTRRSAAYTAWHYGPVR
ncbi:hypothetical protein DEU34_2250 [Microbacterium sp. AG1240]|nr:hypothetical protein DEU34_2250 [Microbacterium sp. AG1240]